MHRQNEDAGNSLTIIVLKYFCDIENRPFMMNNSDAKPEHFLRFHLRNQVAWLHFRCSEVFFAPRQTKEHLSVFFDKRTVGAVCRNNMWWLSCSRDLHYLITLIRNSRALTFEDSATILDMILWFILVGISLRWKWFLMQDYKKSQIK